MHWRFTDSIAFVRKLHDVRLGLADGNEALTGHFVIVGEGDVAPPKRCWIDRPTAAVFDDGPPLTVHPGAVTFPLEAQHRHASTADDGSCVDGVQRLAERRQRVGKRPSRWRGGDGALVVVIVVVVIAPIVVIAMVVVVMFRLNNHVHSPATGMPPAPRRKIVRSRPARELGRARSRSAPGRPRSGAKRSISSESSSCAPWRGSRPASANASPWR